MSGPQCLTASFRSVRCGTPQHIVQARTFLAYAEPFKDTKTVRPRQWWGLFLATKPLLYGSCTPFCREKAHGAHQRHQVPQVVTEVKCLRENYFFPIAGDGGILGCGVQPSLAGLPCLLMITQD